MVELRTQVHRMPGDLPGDLSSLAFSKLMGASVSLSPGFHRQDRRVSDHLSPYRAMPGGGGLVVMPFALTPAGHVPFGVPTAHVPGPGV